MLPKPPNVPEFSKDFFQELEKDINNALESYADGREELLGRNDANYWTASLAETECGDRSIEAAYKIENPESGFSEEVEVIAYNWKDGEEIFGGTVRIEQGSLSQTRFRAICGKLSEELNNDGFEINYLEDRDSYSADFDFERG